MTGAADGLTRIKRPTLLLDTRRVERNIERMVARARAADVRLRPHAKTHQSATIAGWLAERGARGITVSSTAMAEAFTARGFDDITIAFPANPREVEAIDALARRVTLGVLVDAPSAVGALAVQDGAALRVWIKVDVGYGRCGVPHDDATLLETLARTVDASPRLELGGLLTHAGHSYAARGTGTILDVHRESTARMRAAAERLGERGLRVPALSVGDTPTCSVADDWTGIDEIRPGNFVFHDLMQLAIGSCQAEDIAVALACPVVGIYPARGGIVIHGGAVHLGKESLPDADGRPIYGRLIDVAAGGLGVLRDDCVVTALSQEHGIVRVPPERMRGLRIGDVVAIAPVHACLTCDLHDGYATFDGATVERLHGGRWR
jgi:D-serine deaminase-like pyridoxal phosphate-dependent protein